VFERQLGALMERGRESILPVELVARRLVPWRLPRRPVIITFDDGYRSVLEYAEPVLRSNGLLAVVYLTTSLVADHPDRRMSFERRACLTWPEIRALHARGTLVVLPVRRFAWRTL
jgi:hypothetical protein